MSEVAGRMSIQVGAHCLEKAAGGSGMLLGGVPGVPPARVVVLGGGVAGTHAARMAMGMEANVIVIDRSLDRLKQLDVQFGPKLNTIYATVDAIESNVIKADLVIGAVLVPGAAAPKLVTKRHAEADAARLGAGGHLHRPGRLFRDQPARPRTPTHLRGRRHRALLRRQMPGAVARTSTFALNNATLPFALALADKGYRRACAEDVHLHNGLNVHAGKLTYKAVADALKLKYTPAQEALGV